MAATPSPLPRMASRFCSSSTSWILQNGHQSAERKNTNMAPFGPMMDFNVCVLPFWSWAENAGAVCPISGPVLMLWPYSTANESTHANTPSIGFVTFYMFADRTSEVTVAPDIFFAPRFPAWDTLET